MNNVLECIAARASVRDFDDRPLNDEDERSILAAALRAPTAGNMMLYTILKVKNPETRRKLSVTCDNQPFIARAPLSLVFLADFTRWTALYDAACVPTLARAGGKAWEGPSMGDFLLCCCDAMAAAQNAVVAAQSLGVGSCYVGDIMERYEIHRDLFNLPPQAFPVAMLCLGYPAGGAMPRPRSRFDEKYIVHDETYRRFFAGELLEMVGEGKPGADPVEAVRSLFFRKHGAEFSQEMARSVCAAMQSFFIR